MSHFCHTKAFFRPPLSAVLLRKLTNLLNRTDKMGIFKSMFDVGLDACDSLASGDALCQLLCVSLTPAD